MANDRKTKKKSGGWWWLIFVVIALVSQLGENVDFRRMWLRFRVSLLRNGIRIEPIWLLIGAGVILCLLIVIVSRAAAKRREVEDRRPATARTSAAVQRRDPRTKSFTQPDPYCVVCDHTGEDHFQHDKTQRIKQLDEWLKNGLIDRTEYKVLLDRFKRDL